MQMIISNWLEYINQNFGDIQLNMLSEIIGVGIELALIYCLINKLLERQEAKRWKPVRKRLLRKAEHIYNSLLTAARYSMVPRNNDDYYKIRVGFIDKTKDNIKDFEKSIELHYAAMNSYLIPNFTSLIDKSEYVSDKLEFFIRLFDPQQKDIDIVSEPPFKTLEDLKKIIDEFKEKYPEAFCEKKIKINPNNETTLDLVKEQWKEVEENEDRLWLNPLNYEPQNGNKVNVYDSHENQLLLLNLKDQSKNIKLSIYKTNLANEVSSGRAAFFPSKK